MYPYMGEIRAVSFPFAPKGWALCNGQLMAISQNNALFALLGTQFGGDGIRTFGLPNLRGRTPTGQGNGNVMGLINGSETQTMAVNQLPPHTHTMQASNLAGTAGDPTGQVWASVSDGSGVAELAYTEATANTTMNPAALTAAGGNQPIPIMQPITVINYIIALTGIFPSRG